MRKKNIWLRQLFLLIVCTFILSSYGQKFRTISKATINKHSAIGALVTKLGSSAQQYTHIRKPLPVAYPPKILISNKQQERLINKKNEEYLKELRRLHKKFEDEHRKMLENILKEKEMFEKKLKEARLHRFQNHYRRICNAMDQGRAPRDTLGLIRIYNKALEFEQDSIARDCIMRFVNYNPSIAILSAADTIMHPGDVFTQTLPMVFSEHKFYEYWVNPDSSTITANDFGTLATLCEKHGCDEFYVGLARGMEYYLNGNFKNASDIFMKLSENETESTHFEPELKKYLHYITTYMLDCAGRYTDMLTFFKECEDRLTSQPFEDKEQLGLLVTDNHYTTFMLFKAALLTGDTVTATKYMNLCNTINAEYFEEQYLKFYNDIYDYFLDNPQYLEDLDFIIAGFDPENMAENLNALITDLMRKLPDGPDDDSEYYYEETLTPYREAIIEIAHRADSLHNGQLTPQNAISKMLAEISRTSFMSSAQQGRENLKVLFSQLYKKRKDTNYHLPLVLTGVTYSSVLSFHQPKDAAAIIDKIMPIMEIYDGVDKPLLCDTEFNVDIYKYAADLYSKINKKKKAKKMQKRADQYTTLLNKQQSEL